MRAFLIASAAATFFVITNASVNGDQPPINIQSGVQLSWLTNTKDTYHLQWSPNPVGAWTDIVAVTGNGTTNTVYDPVPGGTRLYQVLDIVPGSAPSPASAIVNGGFESGSGTTASNWTVDTAAGGPVYGVRTNDNPNSGSSDFQVHLASTGAGPVVQFNQSGIPVTGGTTNPFTFYANALPDSVGYNAQWRILWNAGGDTGYQTFTPGNNAYVSVSNSVIAPTAATSATIFFHFAGAADPSQSANIDIDDVALGSGSGSGGSPSVTNIIQITSQPTARISWDTTPGTQYQPESTTSLAAGIWNSNSPVVIGDGGTNSVLFPMTNSPSFFRLYVPPVVILPPANLQQIVSGTTNAIGLAWTASTTPGVTGYQILYGLTSGSMTNSMTVGNVNSAIIPNLTSGQTYYRGGRHAHMPPARVQPPAPPSQPSRIRLSASFRYSMPARRSNRTRFPTRPRHSSPGSPTGRAAVMRGRMGLRLACMIPI